MARGKNNKGEKKFKPFLDYGYNERVGTGVLGASPSLRLPDAAQTKDLTRNEAFPIQTKHAELVKQVNTAYACDDPSMAVRQHWQNRELQSKSEPDSNPISVPIGEEGVVHTSPGSSPSLPFPAPVKGTAKNVGPAKQAKHVELTRPVKNENVVPEKLFSTALKTEKKSLAFKNARCHWEDRFDVSRKRKSRLDGLLLITEFWRMGRPTWVDFSSEPLTLHFAVSEDGDSWELGKLTLVGTSTAKINKKELMPEMGTLQEKLEGIKERVTGLVEKMVQGCDEEEESIMAEVVVDPVAESAEEQSLAFKNARRHWENRFDVSRKGEPEVVVVDSAGELAEDLNLLTV